MTLLRMPTTKELVENAEALRTHFGAPEASLEDLKKRLRSTQATAIEKLERANETIRGLLQSMEGVTLLEFLLEESEE